MARPQLHLICNAHLDPVWQWRWEEGCAEALSTFATAVELLHEHEQLIFNHNEAVLYRWVEELDPGLFEEIRQLVAAGRWCISGGWYLQPDANLPGLESFVRHIAEGRRYFDDRFGVRPRVAYNFDSFGHHGGIPQLLRQADFEMYVHLRPERNDLQLPSDFYRWRGVDGSEVLALRIAVGLYHTERDNLEQRLREGTELALRLNRDVPVFWGLGDHGGGATRNDLATIDRFIGTETRVEVVHSTPELLWERLRPLADSAPLVEGDIQRVFTGCYTSLSRIKRRARTSLASLTQCESLCATAWWRHEHCYPDARLGRLWRDHLFNDFHDILPGTCIEPAEQDALDLYGSVSDAARRLQLAATVSLNRGGAVDEAITIAIANTNPALTRVPVEAEFMVDCRPLWTGTWHTKVFAADRSTVVSQEEQPEARLPFNGWRRKLVFMADLPAMTVSNFHVRRFEGLSPIETANPKLLHHFNSTIGLVDQIAVANGHDCLNGPLFEPLVVHDRRDSWGTDGWDYHDEAGRFQLEGTPKVVIAGPVRSIIESAFRYQNSHLLIQTIAYCDWPVLQFRFFVKWNESHKRLKLAVPTVFASARPECEIPGGTITRADDGGQHVHGRWMMMEGQSDSGSVAIGVVNSGQHGIDCRNGCVTLSVLRSAAYCHEQGQSLDKVPATRIMDQGEHEFSLLAIAGQAADVRRRLPALADWLDAPPLVYSHLRAVRERQHSPSSVGGEQQGQPMMGQAGLRIAPATVRLTACKKAYEGNALILRFHETIGESAVAIIELSNDVTIELPFKAFEIKTIRVERNGEVRVVHMIDEI